MARGRTQSIANKERARKAVDMKIAGATWAQVAEAIDMKTQQGARLLVRRYFEINARQQFEEMHPILLERGELLWRTAFQRLANVQKTNGNTDEWEKAFRQCVNAAQFLARISGIGDGPKIEVNVGTTTDVNQLRNEFMRLRAGHTVIDGELADDNQDDQ